MFISTHPRQRQRGFTLVELLTVVVIVGVLATIGTVSYRKFIKSSHTGEAIYMVGSIRAAEESYRAETLSYLAVSSSFPDNYYPSSSPGDFRTAWPTNAASSTHADKSRWLELGVRSDGAVMYGYSVTAGGAAGTMPSLSGKLLNPPTFPSSPTEPWYVVMAEGDVDGDCSSHDTHNCSHVLGTSLSGDIYTENDGE